MKQTLVPAADVLQVHSCESAVRNRKHRASQGTKASGAETNVFDCSFSVPDPAYLADTNDFVAENRHAAEQVLEPLLRRKRQRDAANPEAGDGGRDIELRMDSVSSAATMTARTLAIRWPSRMIEPRL